METMSPSSPMSVSQLISNYDEFSMQQSLLFSDSLKDLKDLRTQLYSAAEHFELSYAGDDRKEMVVEALKDYAMKALVNTVDHLGSVSFKVNGLLDANINEVSSTELRVSCIEQRLRTCQVHIDREGFSQQSLMINTPKHHKRYIEPVEGTKHGISNTKLKYRAYSLDDADDWSPLKIAVQAAIRKTPSSSFRKEHSLSPSSLPSLKQGSSSLTGTASRKELEKRTVSPNRVALLRTGSLSSRSTSTTPKYSNPRWRYPSEPWRSASMRLRPERNSLKDVEHNPSKSKHLFKALLSRHRSKKDGQMCAYIDEF